MTRTERELMKRGYGEFGSRDSRGGLVWAPLQLSEKWIKGF